VETVGAGQSEVEIINVAQTIVVVHAPGLGDEIQAIKAGIMEIGDIFVVNKADSANANKTVTDLQAMLQLGGEKGWRPPVVKTVALTGDGVPELLEKLEEHRHYLEKDPEGKMKLLKAKAEAELTEAIKEKVLRSIVDNLKKEGRLDECLQKILRREKDPHSAAEELLREKGLE
jgi:LAO/AO transport system kinase